MCRVTAWSPKLETRTASEDFAPGVALTAKAARVSALLCGTAWMPKVEVPAAVAARPCGADAELAAEGAGPSKAAAEAPNGSTTAIPAAANMVVIRDATSPSWRLLRSCVVFHGGWGSAEQ